MAQPRFLNLDEIGKELSLTTAIIADGAITDSKILDGSVTASKLATGAVDASILADGSVTALKLNSDVFGAGVLSNATTNAIDVNVDDLTLEINSDQVRVKIGGIDQTHISLTGDLSFGNNQALDFRIENVSSDPTAGNSGRIVFRTDLKQLRLDDGSSFVSVGSGSGSGHLIEDEGTSLPQRASLNFVGTGVTATDDSVNDATVVTIPGAGLAFAKDLFTVVDPLDKTLVLSNTPASNSETVVWNGLVLRPGGTNDYTISGDTITLNAGITLTVADELEVIYAH